MSSQIKYQYTLAPYFEPVISEKNIIKIDLNQSSDFDILFKNKYDKVDGNNLRQFQMERLEFIRKHTSEMNLIAHIIEYIRYISDIRVNYAEYILLYFEVIDGKYGEKPVDFFENQENITVIEKILYYLSLKRSNNRREDYFESVLKSIFCDKVYFYFDKIKNKLYISFLARETTRNKNIYDICKYFFADILLETEVRWRTYPAILDKTNYVIAAEGDQLCGTII